MKSLKRFLSRWKLRRATAAQKIANAWQVEAKALLIKLGAEAKKTRKTIDRFNKRSDSIQAVIESIEEHVLKHEKALESLRNENEVMANVTIPALTSACKLGLERFDAEVAVQVRRRIANQINDENEK